MKISTGAVLPSAFLSPDYRSAIAGFNKTYRNYPIRIGLVTSAYSPEDDNNRSKLGYEYDVLVIEQDENRSIAPIRYRNCISIDSLGGIVDFLEKRYRPQSKVEDKQSQGVAFDKQDGSIVLMMCIDGSSEKGVIIGGVNHPDRKSQLVDNFLAFEANGIAFSIAEDGSAKFQFKGATQTDGSPVDPEQGTTTIQVESDGTVQISHAGGIFRFEKNGKITIQNEGEFSLKSVGDASITTSGNLSLSSEKDLSLKMSKLIIEAQGAASLRSQSLDISTSTKVDLKTVMMDIVAESSLRVRSSSVTVEGQVFLGAAGGQPLVLPVTQFLGIGNKGAPVLSTAVGPFASKAFAV